MKESRLPFVALLVFAIFTSCNRDNVDSFIVEDPQAYNDQIAGWYAEGKSWTNDPILIARELFRPDGPDRKTIIDFEPGENDAATITLTREGLSDDSVGGEMRIIELEKAGGTWTIKKIRLGFKCWDGRGHQNYSGQPCI
ncbi:hypothetical protein WSM22_19090 [Cytophagales bacterium WSM2-2]|nr:hypothetical protein WSM22_19090 [Cytophagales bacterium WSM2-2]